MTILSRESLVIDMSEIILAREEHIPLVATLEASIFSEPTSERSLASMFLGDRSFCAICLENEKLASYCTVFCVLDEAQIINVATDPSYLRRGFARATLEFVFAECKKRSIMSISLEVRESNTPAISLYEALGFEIAGKRKDFYKNPRENALVMIKNLD